ncbi:MAG TPA: hypothetical protein VIG24_12020 [Acidimicrobiia bacterium]
MSRPITFRNINAPDFRQAGSLMQGARDSLNQGVDTFSKLIQQRQGLQAQNLENEKANNTADFRDWMGSMSVDELTEARASGAFDARRDSLGHMVNREELRGAGAERLGVLQDQEASQFAFERAAQDRADAPGLERIQGISQSLLNYGSEDELVQGSEAALVELRRAHAADEISDRVLQQGERGVFDTVNTAQENLRSDGAASRDAAARGRMETGEALLQRALASREGAGADTVSRNQLQKDLLAAGLKTGEVADFTTQFEALAANTGRMADGDTQYMQDVRSEMEKQYGVQNNAFVVADQEPFIDQAATLVKNHSGEGGAFNELSQSAKTTLQSDIIEALSSGVTIVDPISGEPFTMDNVPPALVDMAIAASSDGWIFDRSVKDNLTTLLSNTPGLRDEYRKNLEFREAWKLAEANAPKTGDTSKDDFVRAIRNEVAASRSREAPTQPNPTAQRVVAPEEPDPERARPTSRSRAGAARTANPSPTITASELLGLSPNDDPRTQRRQAFRKAIRDNN